MAHGAHGAHGGPWGPMGPMGAHGGPMGRSQNLSNFCENTLYMFEGNQALKIKIISKLYEFVKTALSTFR